MARSDEQLMAQIIVRDSGALEALIARYEDLLRTHIQRAVSDRMAADDLVQELFLRVWNRAEQWQGHGSLKAWLYRIATNLSLNHLRTVRRRREQALNIPSQMTDDEEERPVPSWMIDMETPGPDDEIALEETQRLLNRVVETLPEDKREVFRLVHQAELSIRDAADTLGIPQGTVKSRLHYAMKHLAREWRDITSEWEDNA